MMETTVNVRKQPKYWAISIAAIMATAFVLVQPAMQTSYAELSSEALPFGDYDNCTYRAPDGSTSAGPRLAGDGPDDPINMDSVKNRDTVKTVHSEKEIFDCFLGQGNTEVIVEVTTFIEIFENITAHEVIGHNFITTTCIKDAVSAQVIDCESNPDPIAETLVPVGSSCEELVINFPQETNTVNKGKIAKTIDAQKEQFICDFQTSPVVKKVDVVIFSEIYEDINTQEVLQVSFNVARCVVLVYDGDTDTRDAVVEGCTFSEIPN